MFSLRSTAIKKRTTSDGHGSGFGYEAVDPDPNPENPDPNPRVYGLSTGRAESKLGSTFYSQPAMYLKGFGSTKIGTRTRTRADPTRKPAGLTRTRDGVTIPTDDGRRRVHVAAFLKTNTTLTLQVHFVVIVMNWVLLGALAVQVYQRNCRRSVLPPSPRTNTSTNVVLFVVIAEALQTLGDNRNTIRAGSGGPWFRLPVLL
ncbi:hypothetical protein GGX14DRAFT_406803 [Mycena pura]|uniref:Uncharacterized protein n=1 Tax=Mycena pura TaxID=153505 RepID=A0AAD6UP86_9AGAR|nr:hypothetical protein GGX14DRAFT_406803 [Mycena pura]